MATTDQDRAARAAHGLATAAAPDVSAAIEGLLARPAPERRLPAKTLDAHARATPAALSPHTCQLRHAPTLSDVPPPHAADAPHGGPLPGAGKLCPMPRVPEPVARRTSHK